jgi:hypothetical protein
VREAASAGPYHLDRNSKNTGMQGSTTVVHGCSAWIVHAELFLLVRWGRNHAYSKRILSLLCSGGLEPVSKSCGIRIGRLKSVSQTLFTHFKRRRTPRPHRPTPNVAITYGYAIGVVKTGCDSVKNRGVVEEWYRLEAVPTKASATLHFTRGGVYPPCPSTL